MPFTSSISKEDNHYTMYISLFVKCNNHYGTETIFYSKESQTFRKRYISTNIPELRKESCSLKHLK